jgi:hypothetical protein
VPNGSALLIPITNPADVVERGAAARLGDAIELDLGGRGIRSIASWGDFYWIVGGAPDEPVIESRLYRWDGTGKPIWLESVDLSELNPEALATVATRERTGLLLISDDGEREIDGIRCKKVADDARKSFRAAWIDAPN